MPVKLLLTIFALLLWITQILILPLLLVLIGIGKVFGMFQEVGFFEVIKEVLHFKITWGDV